VDAVQSGARAGTVHLLPLPSHKVVPRAMGRLSDHGWGLQETLRLSRSLGLRIPRLMLLGVELERVTPSLSRTPSVDAAIESVVECFSELQTALRNSESPLWTGHHAYPALSHGFVNVNTDPRDQAKTANHKG
jgi:Ni,Fe-hydrogenase maturation factor